MNTINVIDQIVKESNIDNVCVCQIDYSQDGFSDDSGIGVSLFHRKNQDYTFIHVDEYLEQTLKSLEMEGYVFNSQVKLKDGTYAHLPLMDFLYEINDTNTEEVVAALKMLGIGAGYLLDSGSSYHFIGSIPVIEQDYIELMYRALLLAPLTDGRWIAHQLINGTSNLRMGEKNGKTPMLLRKLV